jgi:superfamily II DNA or RNA helicase
MITIELHNTRSRLEGNLKEQMKLYKEFKVRHPNAFFMRRSMPRGWDGKIDYITEKGFFQSGLFPLIVAKCEELGINYSVEDYRDELEDVEVETEIGEFKARTYQAEAATAVVKNMVGDILFPRGIIKAATNAGKTLIAAMIYRSFGLKTLYIVNSKDLFNQAVDEDYGQMFPTELGIVSSERRKMQLDKPFVVAMLQTLNSQLNKIKNQLAQFDVVIVDEVDLADSPMYKKILNNLHGTRVRVGLSGSVFISDLKKDLPKKMNLTGFFGPLLYEITNDQLINEEGVSSPVKVNFIKGNTTIIKGMSFKEEYDILITHNKERNKRVVKRVVKRYNQGKKPMMIIGKYHEHIIKMYKLIKKALPDAKVEWVHHKRLNRASIIKDFKVGEVEILIASFILKRGQNMPLMKYMLNAAGTKSPEGILQWLGRATRKSSTKKYTLIEDMWDEGTYLKRHSRKRYVTYKNEKLPVTNKYYKQGHAKTKK